MNDLICRTCHAAVPLMPHKAWCPHKPVKFDSLAQITAHEFVGNHMSDHQAFNAVEAFVRDTAHSLADRAEAVRIMLDKGMGCGRCEGRTDAQVIAEFLSE